MFKATTLLLLLFCSIFPLTGVAQFDLKLYTAEDGLMSSKGRGIYQDENGFIWLIDEYGFNRFNGKEIKSVKSKEKLFEVIGPDVFRKSGDSLFYTNNEYLYNGKYKQLTRNYYKRKKAFIRFVENGEVVDSVALSTSYGMLSQDEASFYYQLKNRSFYLSNGEQVKRIIREEDIGDIIPQDIQLTDVHKGPLQFSYRGLYNPWFFDNEGRFYVKITGKRMLRYNQDLSVDTIRNIPLNVYAAFKTKSGKELFFSNYQGIHCFEKKGSSFIEIAHKERVTFNNIKIRERDNTLYIKADQSLFKLKGTAFDSIQGGIVDFEIATDGSIIAVYSEETTSVYNLLNISAGSFLKESLQNENDWFPPKMFKDKEGNIWVVSTAGFYKLSEIRMTKTTINENKVFEPLAFDSLEHIYFNRGVNDGQKVTELKSLNGSSCFVPSNSKTFYHDHNNLWMVEWKYGTNETDIFRIDKKSFTYKTFRFSHPETKENFAFSSYNRFFFLGNRIFKIQKDTFELIYSDSGFNGNLIPVNYQYKNAVFQNYTIGAKEVVVPNQLLFRKWSSKSTVNDEGQQLKKVEYHLLNTATGEVYPSELEVGSKIRLAVITEKNEQLFFVKKKGHSDQDEEKSTLTIYSLNSKELRSIRRVDNVNLTSASYLTPLFTTRRFLFFKNSENEVFYFNLETYEIGDFESDKVNVGIMHKIFKTSQEDLVYINDMGRSHLVSFENFNEKKDVKIEETFDFNATGFYEGDLHYYFGGENILWSYEKNYTVPIDSIPLFLNEFNVYNDRFELVEDVTIGDERFSSDQNNFVFHFETATYYKPESVSFKYRVKGLNNDVWRTTKDDSVSLEHLSPGQYTLEVVAIGEDAVESNKLSYSITVLPPFWQTWWFRIGAAILLVGMALILYKIRVRKLKEREIYLESKVKERTIEVVRQKERAEEQHMLVEEKNKEIIDSINYAKRLQDAILPSEKIISSYLMESFIFYRPKDIIAGDFYFMDAVETEGKKLVYYAAADCTGHGVPGAMVSIVGANGLKRCIQELGLRDPGLILDRLSEIVADNFAESEEQIRDGMDIALCCLEMEGEKIKKVSYSGAHNPLWVINPNRKGLPEFGKPFKNGGGFEIKADKQAIGYTENRKHFTTKVFDVEEGDVLYTFSDGFADQFGGPKGKKYKTVNFKNYLVNIYDLPLRSQKSRVVEEFNRWKGSLEQIDDVCVIGVKVG